MRRTNTFDVAHNELLSRVSDASPSLWNELNYARQEAYFGDGNVWEIDQDNYRKQYMGVLGSATAQQVIRKNDEAWRGFFSSDEPGKGLPGYWGNRDEGRDLQTYIRNDSYTLEWGERSRLEIPVGRDLKEEYDLGYNERLRLEVAGNPRWQGEQGRLEIHVDELTNRHRAFQPVTVDPDSSPLCSEALASHEAALDVGANNLVACTVSTGDQYLYSGADGYEQFRETTDRIGYLQSKLPPGKWSSDQIRRLYRKRARRRDHSMSALAKDLFDRLHEAGVSTVYVGDLTGVLSTHWSVESNRKTHNFWSHRKFINRLETTAEHYGIEVIERSEQNTTRECPECGEKADTERHGDYFRCPCGYEGHADLDASVKFLGNETNHEIAVGCMAVPVRLKWDDHEWSELPYSVPNEQRTNLKVASVGSGGSTTRTRA